MDEVIRIVFEHLFIWVTVFIVACGQTENIKEASVITIMFMILLYTFFAYFYIIIKMGGHIPI